MKANFETERLIIRPMVPDDAKAVFQWCGDPNVNTYMIYPLYHRVEDVHTWLESRDPDDPDNYDEGIVLKSTGELIGSGGMRYRHERNAWEIGYNIRKDQWGHGYTVEYLTALMDYIRKTRPVEAIDGIFASENRKSQRVMEKLGMVYVRDTSFDKLDGSRTFQAKYYRRNLPQPADQCMICSRIGKIIDGINPYFVKELETGYVVVGDHQRFEGYTLLLCKEHATELNQLSPDFRSAFLRDMAMVAEAVQNAFRPEKLNYELLGTGKGRHMHWHFFPRRIGDTPRPGPVWQDPDLNNDCYLPSPKKLEELKTALRKELDLLEAAARKHAPAFAVQNWITGIHHVSMKCGTQEDFDKAKNFYLNLLGFTVRREWADGIMIDTGCGLLEIFCNGEGIRSKGAVRHIAFAAKEVDAVIRKVRNAGYVILTEPEEIVIPSVPACPARMAFCIGPLGEEIEFFQER